MKTKEELNFLREEIDALRTKLAELNEEELRSVTGGVVPDIRSDLLGLKKPTDIPFYRPEFEEK